MPKVMKLQGKDRFLTDLQMWAVSSGASTWLIDLEPGERCRVAVLVDRVRIDPAEHVIEASITDGTATTVAQWSTEHTSYLPVIPGDAVLLEGVAAMVREGEIVLSEPLFESITFPALE
jgi:hypothetical protein